MDQSWTCIHPPWEVHAGWKKKNYLLLLLNNVFSPFLFLPIKKNDLQLVLRLRISPQANKGGKKIP